MLNAQPKKEVDFCIVSAPVGIRLECPHCELDIEIRWKDVDVPESWSDQWPDVACPMCGKEISLGDWDYD